MSFVGKFFRGYDGSVYLCVQHDHTGYWMASVPRLTSVSERAIGRTFHRARVADPDETATMIKLRQLALFEMESGGDVDGAMPARWVQANRTRCIAGHINEGYDPCATCRGYVLLTFPEDPGGPLEVMVDEDGKLVPCVASAPTHPMQPIHFDPDGVIRFRANSVVRYLLDAGPFDMNHLVCLPNIPAADFSQFAQLIGYSVGGFAELSYADEGAVAAAEAEARQLREGRQAHPRERDDEGDGEP